MAELFLAAILGSHNLDSAGSLVAENRIDRRRVEGGEQRRDQRHDADECQDGDAENDRRVTNKPARDAFNGLRRRDFHNQRCIDRAQ